jgi:hypothetical protein
MLRGSGGTLTGGCDGNLYITISATYSNYRGAYGHFPLSYFFYQRFEYNYTVVECRQIANQFRAQIAYSSDGSTFLIMNIAILAPNMSTLENTTTPFHASAPASLAAVGSAANKCTVVETDTHTITICKK